MDLKVVGCKPLPYIPTMLINIQLRSSILSAVVSYHLSMVTTSPYRLRKTKIKLVINLHCVRGNLILC